MKIWSYTATDVLQNTLFPFSDL